MATRSTISMKVGHDSKSGLPKYQTIYSHWDGYPSGVGKTLLEHYTDEKKIKQLIKLGAISSLGKDIKPKGKVGKKREFTKDGIVYNDTTEKHSFDNPWYDVTVAYHRDRGESLDINTYLTKEEIMGEAYDYLYENGQWFVRAYNGKFEKLTLEMVNE